MNKLKMFAIGFVLFLIFPIFVSTDVSAPGIEDGVENFLIGIFLYCIVGAAMLALVTFVTVKFVNKKHQENTIAKLNSKLISDEDSIIVEKASLGKRRSKIKLKSIIIHQKQRWKNKCLIH